MAISLAYNCARCFETLRAENRSKELKVRLSVGAQLYDWQAPAQPMPVLPLSEMSCRRHGQRGFVTFSLAIVQTFCVLRERRAVYS